MDPTYSTSKRKRIVKTIIFAIILIGTFAFFGLQHVGDHEEGAFREKIAETVKSGISSGISAPGVLFAKVESSNVRLSVSGIYTGTNAERVKVGALRLTLNSQLNIVAQKRMEDMFARGYFEHVSPQGQSASTVAEDVMYEYATIGENIAMGNFATDAVLVQAWMDSPGHRENILRSQYTEIGIAVGKGNYNGRDTWIGVQIFAKPLSACPAVDQNLKSSLEREIAELETLNTELAQKDEELQTLKNNQNTGAYNAKVAEYNALVKEVNDRSSKLKVMTDEYNVSVRAFNACIK
jgi:uncharacterized protein YkwD